MADVWTLDASAGQLLIHTGITGRAARMGHRLTIAMTRWQATVNWAGTKPVAAELAVEVDSFEVLRGDGGLKGLSRSEKAIVRSNALRSLSVNRFPEIRFTAHTIDRTGEGFRLAGILAIRGKLREHVIDLHSEDLGESWRMSAQSGVRQSQYGVKPYSLLMGSVQVADDVVLSFTADRTKEL